MIALEIKIKSRQLLSASYDDSSVDDDYDIGSLGPDRRFMVKLSPLPHGAGNNVFFNETAFVHTHSVKGCRIHDLKKMLFRNERCFRVYVWRDESDHDV